MRSGKLIKQYLLQMNQKRERASDKVSLCCGILGLLGCLAAIVTDLIGIIVVEQHNPISETISSLAITKLAWIQDSGLSLFAFGMIACAIALSRWNTDKAKWKIGTLLLFLLGIDILLIAQHNQYAGREGVGASIHLQCVIVMAVLFTLITILLASGLREAGRNWYRYSMGTAIFWLVLSPIFFIMPTHIDGAYERFIALIMISWVTAISWILIQHGRGKLSKVR